MLSRPDVVNHFAAKFGYESYLEIGVEGGVTFNQVMIKRKVAVDPHFKVPVAQLSGEACSQTSDAWFDDNPDVKFDCIFVDGLHLAEQALRDTLRSMSRLSEGGVILLDDCYPSDEVAAWRDQSGCYAFKEANNSADRNWMGDVYRTILFLHDFIDAFEYAYIQNTMGIVAVWSSRRKITPVVGSLENVATFEYEKFRKLVSTKIKLAHLDEICAAMQNTSV